MQTGGSCVPTPSKAKKSTTKEAPHHWPPLCVSHKITCNLDSSQSLALLEPLLFTGQRVVFGKGHATDYVYSSAALAGILPPLVDGPHVLMDGAYADIAPVDIARATGADVVIAVDPSQRENAAGPKNGIQAMMRSIEVCQYEHARLRFEQADLVIRPRFSQTIGTLEFRQKRHCIAAGAMAIRQAHNEISALLDP